MPTEQVDSLAGWPVIVLGSCTTGAWLGAIVGTGASVLVAVGVGVLAGGFGSAVAPPPGAVTAIA